jgi:glutathione peroxidase
MRVRFARPPRMTTAYDFEQKTIDGEPKSLADYRGKALLLVNVASKCGLTPQYTGLEELYRGMKDRGLLVLGFPCNQFAGQEPGTEAEIKQFCSTSYDVTFPLFAKLDVNGAARHPLYAWLTAQPTQPDGPGDIKWNFGKFLIDRQGNVAARFSPTTSPTSPDVVEAIERVLGA